MSQPSGNIYETFFNNSVEGIVIFDAIGKIVKANPKAEELFGYDTDLDKKNINNIISKKYSTPLTEICTALIAGKAQHQRNKLIIPDYEKNGKKVVLSLHLNNHIRSEDGKPLIAAVVIDETQDWSTRQELKESHERFRKAFYNNPIAQIIVRADNGNIRDANRQFLALSGYVHDEVIGENISFAGMTPCTENKPDHKIFSDTEHVPNDCEAIMRLKNGNEIDVLQSYASIKLNGAPHELWTIIDLSTIKQAELHLKHLNEALEHKVYERTQDLTRLLEREKLINDLKARFIAMASHEFRTPLTTILASAGLLETFIENNDADKSLKHVGRIKSSVKLLNEILEDFLSLNNIEQGLVKPFVTGFNITDLADKITDEARATLKQGQHIAYTHSGPELVKQDINILKNVLLNLLANASKYSAEGTAISWITCVKRDKIVITVADSGMGIPEDDQPHIFTRFFRARNAEALQGTGLGLHIARKYVKLLHGQIHFVSKENAGTTFMVEVPLLK